MKNIKSNPIKTILTISIGFLLLYLIGKQNWALWVAIGIGAIGIISEKLSVLIEKLWFKLALILSYIVPNIIMGAIFFLFLFPIALLSKIFKKKDSLKLKNNIDTVYSERVVVYDKTHFENMW
jgi:hypothetical protein